MTQKELLYVEDATNHEKSIIDICNEIINNLSDEELIELMQKDIKKHTSMQEKLIKCMEDNCNE